MRKKPILKPIDKNVRKVCGLDVSYSGDIAVCASVIYDMRSREIVDSMYRVENVESPYVPGYLYKREGPIMVNTARECLGSFDVLLIDGNGIMHPEMFGLACYVGVSLNCPTVGVAKNPLTGTYQDPGKQRGDFQLVYNSENVVIGTVLRTRDNVKPVYVSPGHLCDVMGATHLVMMCSAGFRIPEPIRLAHIYSRKRLAEIK